MRELHYWCSKAGMLPQIHYDDEENERIELSSYSTMCYAPCFVIIEQWVCHESISIIII